MNYLFVFGLQLVVSSTGMDLYVDGLLFSFFSWRTIAITYSWLGI